MIKYEYLPLNIPLTGGTGYIGNKTAVALANAGHFVVLLDNFSNSDKKVSGCINQIAKQAVPCIKGDVQDTH